MSIHAHPYFLPKSAEHVTLAPFTADQSEPRNIPLVRVCEVDEVRGMQRLVAISASGFELSKNKLEEVVLAPIVARAKFLIILLAL